MWPLGEVPQAAGVARTPSGLWQSAALACAAGCVAGALVASTPAGQALFYPHTPAAPTIVTRPVTFPAALRRLPATAVRAVAGPSDATPQAAVGSPAAPHPRQGMPALPLVAALASAAAAAVALLLRHGPDEQRNDAAPLFTVLPDPTAMPSRREWPTGWLPSACYGRSVALYSTASVAPTPPQCGQFSIIGSVRKQNEDRFDVGPMGPAGLQFFGVYDGHGGNAVSEWLAENLRDRVGRLFNPAQPESTLSRAFIATDKEVLKEEKTFFGIPGERGIGGSQCGATAVVAVVYEVEGVRKLAVANVGDSRCLLIKADGTTEMLTVDHVPDNERERLRIEAKNPNPRMPLVQFVGETWRVGGVLALSRAFGDAYMKSAGEYEGKNYQNSDYSSGFGVVAEPSVAVVDLADDVAYVLLSSDGLYANEERGGGGGFELPEVGEAVKETVAAGKSLNDIAQSLCFAAQERGSTDDITVLLWRVSGRPPTPTPPDSSPL